VRNGTAPQARDSTTNAVHGTCDVAGATVEDNTLWGGKCILFDNAPRLRVADHPAIEDAERITIEALSERAELAPAGRSSAAKRGSYILYNYARLFLAPVRVREPAAVQHRGRAWERDLGLHRRHLRQGPTTSASTSVARVAQMSDTAAISLNSAPLGIGRHVSGVAHPFNGRIDEFRISHVHRSDGLPRRPHLDHSRCSRWSRSGRRSAAEVAGCQVSSTAATSSST
jgi:hypothetical protein